MMGPDFDEIVDRTNTDSLKYDFAQERGKPEGVLPLWVADMDFRAPQCVLDALTEKARHGIFGYSETKADYFDAVHDWLSSRFGWEVRPEWLVKTPGVVFAASMAIQALTQEGEAVLVQEPVYYPFAESILANRRRLVVNQLVYDEGGYRIDFDDFEEKVRRDKVRLFILCSPHNPVGRVWSRDELARLGKVCRENGVIVVADEIHADFTYPGHTHQVFAGLSPEFADFTITCTSPTKTFNLAGLQISNIFIPNAALRQRFCGRIACSGYSQGNLMGIVACQAAYRGGAAWLEGLRGYLTGNLGFLRGYLRKAVPRIRLVEPEGTYLAWLDCSGLGLEDKALDDFMVNRAGLWLDGGAMFGAGGSGFQRINIACPRAVLKTALDRLAQAVDGLGLS